ncbi:MAG: histidine--tRNA ligase [Actinomyces sp.]|nr:MAG: histidine--tRNA ligase [Actinomyces sp.]
MASPTFRAPKGTRDILSPESERRRALVEVFAALAGRAGFGEIESPLFENIGVFLRVGETTDIVTKEMFDFHDKGDPPEHLALRPELTASICRAFVEHRPVVPWKVWYAGPQFRYEQPQAGRYRQFTQVGVEVLGVDDPLLDVEIIALARRFYDTLGLGRVRLLLNSLGDPTCRPAYLEALTAHLLDHAAELSPQARVTLERNPLRVLDSKRAEDQAVIDAAPVMVDHLTDESAAHFAAVTSGLDRLGIDYEISPRLVRGLDYYTRTTFEFAADALPGAQNAVGGGGRYDGLVADLGGPDTPGIGFALGVDRTLLACDAEGVFPAPATAPDVFVVDVVDGTHALTVCEDLRAAGLAADRAYGGRSMKAQMKAAGRSGARLAVIVGDDELATGRVTVRDLERGEQTTVPRDDLVEHVRRATAQ